MESLVGEKSFNIGSISPITTSNSRNISEGNFVDMLKNNIQDTNKLINTADQYRYDYTVLRNRELHEVMIAAQEASVALKMTMQVRNKVIEAYQELLRMQV
jgi:flagellar hook-basal body complex protein FliE